MAFRSMPGSGPVPGATCPGREGMLIQGALRTAGNRFTASVAAIPAPPPGLSPRFVHLLFRVSRPVSMERRHFRAFFPYFEAFWIMAFSMVSPKSHGSKLLKNLQFSGQYTIEWE